MTGSAGLVTGLAEVTAGAAGVPPVLLRYGRDLTAEAEAGRLPPVIGRQAEMLQVVRVLRRRTKNSPVLIGEAGVGKTAVVEGLAQRIAEGTALPGRRIVALSLASLVAGTSYRGQFEERLEEILVACRSRPDLILFLDELHTIVGAGDVDGRLDAANILKPALARGEIACIGATTTEEYRRHVESDAALERRFQPILVAEPSPAETLAILAGLRDDLERHHGVTIEAEALDAAVGLTVRYVTGRRLPDKAVDALDEACARASVPALTDRAGLLRPAETESEIEATDGAEAGASPVEIGEAVIEAEASPVGAGETVAEGGTLAMVTAETVAEVVSSWTGVPLGQVGRIEAERLAGLEARLGERVVGQDGAIRQVAQRVRLARMGLTDHDRPAGVFLFLGPSGVGKTALARALAEIVTASSGGGGSPDAWAAGGGVAGAMPLIRLDLSEYGEKHQVARLIGVPPGYQGHEAEGQLTGALRRSPRAVVLLDEVEKAHPDLFDLLLPLFGEGRLTDGHGRLVDGRQAIYVLTSNVGASGAGRRALGFGPGATAETEHEALLSELRQVFRPELLNRIDEIVLFRALGEAELTEIARRRLMTLGQRLLEQHGVTLTASEEALVFVGRQAATGSGGAREAQRLVTRSIEEPLSRELLAGRLVRGSHLRVDPQRDTLALVPDPDAT